MQNKNKGFTLVELIVTIVILGILAAMMIPALLGYIDRAQGQQIVLNGKSVLTAAQADMSAAYAKGMDLENDFVDKYAQDILETADVPSATKIVIGTGEKYGTARSHPMYTVTYVYYEEGDKKVVYNGTSWDEPASGYTPLNGDGQYFEIK